MGNSISIYSIPGIGQTTVVDRRKESISQKFREIKISYEIAKYFGVTVRELKSKSREQSLVIARYFCFHFLLQLTTLNHEKIALEYGGKDTSSISKGLKSLERTISQNYKGYRDHFKKVEAIINDLGI